MSKIHEVLEVNTRGRQNEKEDIPIQASEEKRKGFPQELVVMNKPGSEIAEYFRFLRSKITRPPEGNPPRTIMITSALMGEGKTFVACNLAAAISQSIEEYVLLMDTDIRHPRAHQVFGLPFQKNGLSTYLTNNVPLSDLLIKTGINKLTILPAGNSTHIPAELLSSEKMKSLILEVRDRYRDRFVVIDSPPLELAPESSVVANTVDAVILVVRYGKTPRSAVLATLEKIPKEKLLGVVFNAYEKPLQRYGYYRYGKYGYGKQKG